jgi:REP element-mobilizing transposase RayT
LLNVLAHGIARFDAQVLAYCLMDNHYHFVLHTRSANLSRLMRHVNGIYTQSFNRRHGKAGHLFQGRFKAILVDREAYLLEVCRYVELNPVRAGMVAQPGDWVWSSYRAHLGEVATPQWLDTDGLHAHLLSREPTTTPDHRRANRLYADLVAAGRHVNLWDTALNKQIYLGDDDFVQRMQQKAQTPIARAKEAPKAQRSVPRTLKYWLAETGSHEEALRCAYVHSGISMTALAAEMQLTVARVSQLIARAEKAGV